MVDQLNIKVLTVYNGFLFMFLGSFANFMSSRCFGLQPAPGSDESCSPKHLEGPRLMAVAIGFLLFYLSNYNYNLKIP